jgi:queuine tRNA-ribosyltransferase
MMQPDVLQFPNGKLHLPAFLPDATRGVVRSVDSADLKACGIEALVMNLFHLMRKPGSSAIQSMGGLHRMCGWDRPIFTDSGGFQAYSLIRENARYGRIGADGMTFWPDGSDRKFVLTAEKTVQLQLSYGSNVVICLDDCTHPDDSAENQQCSVERTVRWARRCKEQFEKILEQRKVEDSERPLIMGIIQGGKSLQLRRQCAEQLLETGFDCFGFGGWPLDAEGNLLREITAYTRELVPREFPMHALGIGHPVSIVHCVADGYNLFDSALPTRDARRGRLYGSWPSAEILSNPEWFRYIYINDKKYIRHQGPIVNGCDCSCCQNFSAAYLHHLFEIEDSLSLRLATIHNLHVTAKLMNTLRARVLHEHNGPASHRRS